MVYIDTNVHTIYFSPVFLPVIVVSNQKNVVSLCRMHRIIIFFLNLESFEENKGSYGFGGWDPFKAPC